MANLMPLAGSGACAPTAHGPARAPASAAAPRITRNARVIGPLARSSRLLDDGRLGVKPGSRSFVVPRQHLVRIRDREPGLVDELRDTRHLREQDLVHRVAHAVVV